MFRKEVKKVVKNALGWPSKFLLGDDIFISYSHADGATYAAGLADKLAERSFTCRFDMWGAEPGKQMPKSLKKALARSALLVLVGTKGAAKSEHVALEVAEMKRLGRRIVPLAFAGVLLRDYVVSPNVALVRVEGAESMIPEGAKEALWACDIEGLPVSCEGLDAEGREVLKTGEPSSEVVRRIEKTFTFTRKDERLRKASAVVGGVLLLLIGASVVAGYIATKKGAEASRMTVEAVAAEARARDAERKAQEQEENARRQTARAEDAASKATEAERVTAEQTKLAADKTRLADASARRADEQAQRAAAQETSAHKSLARTYDTQAQAETPFSPVRALAWAGMAVRQAPASDEHQASYLVRAMNLASHAPQSVLNLPSGFSPVSFSASGDMIMTVSDQGQLGVWDVRAGTSLPLPGLGSDSNTDAKLGVYWDRGAAWTLGVNSVAPVFSQNGKRAAALVTQWTTKEGELEWRLKVWETRTGTALRDIRIEPRDTEGEKITSLTFSPNGEEVILFTKAAALMLVWDVASGKRLEYEKPIQPSEYLNQKGYLPVSQNPERNWFINFRENDTSFGGLKRLVLEVRDIKTGKSLTELPLASTWFGPLEEKAFAVELTADARKAVVMSIDGQDARLRVWDVVAGKVVKTMTLPGKVSGKWNSQSIQNTEVHVNLDSSKFLVKVNYNTYQLWNIGGERPEQLPYVWLNGLSRAHFTDDGEYVVGVSQKEVRVWSIHSLRRASRPVAIHEGATLDNISTRDKTVAFTYKDGTMQTWDLTDDGSQGYVALDRPHSEDDSLDVVMPTPDGESLLTVEKKKGIQLWDARTGSKKWSAEMPYKYYAGQIKFSPDGTRFIVMPIWTVSGTPLKLEDGAPVLRRTRDGAAEPGFRPIEGFITALEFSRDGTELATMRRNWTDINQEAAILIFGYRRRAPEAAIIERRSATTGALLPGGRFEVPPTEGAFDGFTRYGEYFMTRRPGAAPEISLWKLDSPRSPLVRLRFENQDTAQMAEALIRQAQELRLRGSDVVAVLSSGVAISVVSSPAGALLMNERAKARLVVPVELGSDLLNLLFSPDGRLVATSSTSPEGSLLRVWDSTTGLPLSESLWDEGQIKFIAFTADSKRLLTTNQYGVLRSWFFNDFKDGAPSWMTRMGEALSGLRVVGGMDVQRIPPDEHAKLRREFWAALRSAAASGDESAQFLLVRQRL